APDAIAKDFFGSSNSPPEFRVHALQDLEHQLWPRPLCARPSANPTRRVVDKPVDDRDVKVIEQHTVLARTRFESGHHGVRDDRCTEYRRGASHGRLFEFPGAG